MLGNVTQQWEHLQLPCSVAITSTDGLVLSVNDELTQVLGASQEHCHGQSLEAFLAPPSRIFLQTHVWPMLRNSGELREVSLNLLTTENQLVPVLVNARMGRVNDTECVNWIFFVSCERSRFEAELVKARGHAQTLAVDLSKAHQFLERAGRLAGVGAWRLDLTTSDLM